jgi:hypothetical protein
VGRKCKLGLDRPAKSPQAKCLHELVTFLTLVTLPAPKTLVVMAGFIESCLVQRY